MKVVGENVKIFIIETGLWSLSVKHLYMKVSHNFDHSKTLKLSVTIFLRHWKGNDMSFFVNNNNVLLASMMCPQELRLRKRLLTKQF